MFLGTPVGGNEKITVDRLKQGLALMRFTIDEVRTGQLGKGKISARWCVSPEDFQLDPTATPAWPNSEDTACRKQHPASVWATAFGGIERSSPVF